MCLQLAAPAAPADPRLRRQEVARELSESHPAAAAWVIAPEQPHEEPGETQVLGNGILNLQLWGIRLQLTNKPRFAGCRFFQW